MYANALAPTESVVRSNADEVVNDAFNETVNDAVMSTSAGQGAAFEAAQRVAQMCRSSYLEVRVLDDLTVVALLDLLFTRAICMDLDPCGYGRRFCFEDRALADEQFWQLRTGDDEPSGAIAQRGARPAARLG